MRVTVTSLVDAKTGLIGFTTQYGDGVGHWQGDLPVVGHSYEVELSVDAALRCGIDLNVVGDEASPMLRVTGIGTELVGELIAVEEDGSAVVRMAESVLMLDVLGATPPLPSWVRLGPLRLSLHDTSI